MLSRLRYVLALCLVGANLGIGSAQTGWAVSPVVTIPAVSHEVLGSQPECEGDVVVEDEVRRVTEVLRRPGSGEAELPPTRLSLFVARALSSLGLKSMRQDYANCVEICVVIPMAATSVTDVIGYVAFGATAPFAVVPIGRYWSFFKWDEVVDTTRVGPEGRFVCIGAMGWIRGEGPRAFLVVGYE